MNTNFDNINFDQDNENLSIYINNTSIQTHASYGAKNMVSVDTCDGRPESTIPGKPERTAVRLSVYSDYQRQRVNHNVTLTAVEALELARKLIAQATCLIPSDD